MSEPSSSQQLIAIGSDDETTDPESHADIPRFEFESAMEAAITEIENVRIVAAGWIVQLPNHRYVDDLKADVNNFCLDSTLKMSAIESNLNNQSSANVSLRSTTLDIAADMVAKLKVQWVDLKDVVHSMIEEPDSKKAKTKTD